MLRLRHVHAAPPLSGHLLQGKTLYIPAMEEAAARVVAAAFRWLGVDARVTPPSDQRTLELGGKVTNGDECYPAKVTFGDLLRVIEQPGFDPAHTAFLMATSDGPCRFGQYAISLRRLLREQGYGDVQIVSPHDKNGYADLGDIARPLLRTVWRGVVATDILRRLLLKTRPYETRPGDSDLAYQESVDELCATVTSSCARPSCQLKQILACLLQARLRFHRIPARYDKNVPLIGVIGEAFCRMNAFSNQDLIRNLESCGAEVCLSTLSEWVEYTNADERLHLHTTGRGLSLTMMGSRVRGHFQHADERALLAPFRDDFAGYEEPGMEEILALGEPYLPAAATCGEMVVSMGKAVYLAQNGADGIIDISPFSCMNGTVCEALYPMLSQDHGGIPIRNFYFDGTRTDLHRDLTIYMELAHRYHESKRYPRRYPAYFDHLRIPAPPALEPGLWTPEAAVAREVEATD